MQSARYLWPILTKLQVGQQNLVKLSSFKLTHNPFRGSWTLIFEKKTAKAYDMHNRALKCSY